MKFERLAHLFEKLEHTSSSKQRILAEFLKTAEPIDKICYLILGSANLGMADQMVIKSIAYATGRDESSVLRDFKKAGDLGNVVEKDFAARPTLTVVDVFSGLRGIA